MSRSKSVEYFCDGCLYSSVYINSELNVHCLVLDNSFYIKYIVVNNDQHSMFICNMKDEQIYNFDAGTKLTKETVAEAKRILKLKLFL